MKSLTALADTLDQITETGHPPVHLWKPERKGEIDIIIKHDCRWIHEGGEIKREALVKLFSTVLWLENGEHYLKTPAEQLKITVETTPFLITSMEVSHAGTPQQQIAFMTSYGDTVILGMEHPLTLNKTLILDQEIPLVKVRYGMQGRLSRSVFNELVELGEHESSPDGDVLNILSNGANNPLSFN
jgi:hypothetical protein